MHGKAQWESSTWAGVNSKVRLKAYLVSLG